MTKYDLRQVTNDLIVLTLALLPAKKLPHVPMRL